MTAQPAALKGTTGELSALLGRSRTAAHPHPSVRNVLLEHEERVGTLCHTIAIELGLPLEEAADLRLAGELHDIGKRIVPEPMLLKPGPLTSEEWELVHQHPAVGAELLVAAGLDRIAGWVLAHHERPDGRGYPFGLTDEELPLGAKILAVADAFDAMTSERTYKGALEIDEALAELGLGTGTQFDGDVVAALVRFL